MNESALCYQRMSGCNEMFCDETTNATNIAFGTHIPLTIEIDLLNDVEKFRHFGSHLSIFKKTNI
jgi:hypothetical protein